MPIYAGQIIKAADLVPTEWQPVTFENTWHNFGNGWSDCQFRYHPLQNATEVKGTIDGRDSSGANVVASESLAFNLPEGYRPIANVAVGCGHVSSPVSTNIEVRFYSDGQVTVIGADALTNPVVVIDGVMLYIGE